MVDGTPVEFAAPTVPERGFSATLVSATSGDAQVRLRFEGDLFPGRRLFHVVVPTDQGGLYLADLGAGSWDEGRGRVQKRDARGNWTELAASGNGPGRVRSPSGLAVDGEGSLYVTDWSGSPPVGSRGRLQKRDAGGRWTELASPGTGIGPRPSGKARCLS